MSTKDQPPTYDQATGSSGKTVSHQARNGIPPDRRRSMEDEARPLPAGWVRSYDPESEHQFFVDTTKEPPRSIWHHPYDDEEFLASLSSAEREQADRLHKSVSLRDIEAESSDEEDGRHHSRSKLSAIPSELPPRPSSSSTATPDQPHGLHKFGRRLKDKLTHSTHEERERSRQQRAEEERAAYEQHQRVRQAFTRAIETGEPQFVGKDQQGRDIYLESPYGPPPPAGAYGYNPYAQGAYANPNARFVRPQAPYDRPYGYGYGGGYGLPLLGGLFTGAVLGGLLF